MISFGLLTLNTKVEHLYFTELARKAAKHSMNVFRFSPEHINPKTEQVHGEKFNSKTGSWEKAIYPIPQCLYDRCFYPTKEQQKKYYPIINWLKNRPDLTFIGHGLPNKWSIYEVLSSDPLLTYYIPKTRKVNSVDDIFHYLKKHKKALLKPENGSQGKGIIALTHLNESIELHSQQNNKNVNKVFANKAPLYQWLKKLISSHSYLMQPFLALQDSDGHAFDIRVLVQKKPNNQWAEIGRGIRKGGPGSIISNLHGGGSICSYKDWIKQIEPHQRVLIEDELRTIITSLPASLEKKFGPLFEIGIDIGVATDGTVWVLDANSKPGYKTILQSNPSVENHLYEAPLLYCKNLVLQRSASDGII
ncbi:YheC/YheD family endospore coat-associated protein [Bacillus sp. Marseille-P3661]|uniref:YheC/YheD family endospore coat-associated protein n=1 Tax=Bacillus sp. Marseille-P3661 TaxID=1936234 RepID=UPI000C866180|nr:YheC/YheD family protein [Bacillus sp. Marseille-P3661]